MSQKILTLGPASSSQANIRELLSVATSFRLNIAHLSAIALKDKLEELHDLYIAENKSIPVTLDLQGAKVRIGRINSVTSLPNKVTLIYSDKSDIPNEIPVTFKSVFDKTRIGDSIYL